MTELVLRTDKEWGVIDGEVCRVKVFTPLASVDDGRVTALSKTTPYASITIECPVLPQEATGFIAHRDDFLNLWRAFEERGIGEDEEVIVHWIKKSQLRGIARLMSKTMPGLSVWICPKHAYELMTDEGFRPELTGSERFDAWSPLEQWTPKVFA